MKRVTVGLFLLLLLVAIPFSVSRLRQRVEYQGKAAGDTASLTLLPTSLSLTPGSGAFLEVFVDTGDASTSGIQLVISYDSSKIEITDNDQNSANGIQIRNDNLYKLTISNQVDPAQNAIIFMAGAFDPQTGRAAPVTGAGRVATINFRVKDGAAIGSTPFNFKFLGTSATICDASSCGAACAGCDSDVYLYQPGINEDILARVESRSVNIIGNPTVTPIATNTPRPTNTPPPSATNTPTPTPQCTTGQTKCCDTDPISGPYRVQNCNSLGRWSSCTNCSSGWSCRNGSCQLMTPTPTIRPTGPMVTNTPTPTTRPTATSTPRPTNTPPPGATNTPTPTPQCTSGQTKCCDTDPISGPYRVQNCNSLRRWGSCVDCDSGWSCRNGSCQFMTPTPTLRPTVTSTPRPTNRPTNTPVLTATPTGVPPTPTPGNEVVNPKNIATLSVDTSVLLNFNNFVNPVNNQPVPANHAGCTWQNLVEGEPWAGNSTWNIYILDSGRQGMVIFPRPVIVKSVLVSSEESNLFTLSSTGNSDVSLLTSGSRPRTLVTNWTQPITSLILKSSADDQSFDDLRLTIKGGSGTPTLVPTSTPTPSCTQASSLGACGVGCSLGRRLQTRSYSPQPFCCNVRNLCTTTSCIDDPSCSTPVSPTPPIPTPTGISLVGDLNKDGRVDIADLVLVGANFGTHNSQGDVNGDGVVNISDLVLVGANFGRSR